MPDETSARLWVGIHWLIFSEICIKMGRNLNRYVVMMDGKG
jgi:hypothetical protein